MKKKEEEKEEQEVLLVQWTLSKTFAQIDTLKHFAFQENRPQPEVGRKKKRIRISRKKIDAKKKNSDKMLKKCTHRNIDSRTNFQWFNLTEICLAWTQDPRRSSCVCVGYIYVCVCMYSVLCMWCMYVWLKWDAHSQRTRRQYVTNAFLSFYLCVGGGVGGGVGGDGSGVLGNRFNGFQAPVQLRSSN